MKDGKWLKEYKYDDFLPSSDSLFTVESLNDEGFVYKFIIPKYFDGMSLESVAYDKYKDILELHTRDYFGNYIYGWDYDEDIPEFKKCYMELKDKVLCTKEETNDRKAISITRIRYTR